MTGLIIKALLGLFIWQGLPSLIYSKQRSRKNTSRKFVILCCKIVGILMIILACIELIKWLLNYN